MSEDLKNYIARQKELTMQRIQRGFEGGDYITRKIPSKFPSLNTMRIRYLVGKSGAEATTAIAGDCTIEDLDAYRKATTEEIINFLAMELDAYKRVLTDTH